MTSRHLAYFIMIGGVIGVLIAGLVVIGSPQKQRQRQFDARRVKDLQSIARAVDRYWTRHKELPGDLDVLGVEPDLHVTIRDPETDDIYEYRITGESSFELCAVFTTTLSEETVTHHHHQSRGGIWFHPASRHCFTLEVENSAPDSEGEKHHNPGK
jgi:hypothetical protein